MRVGIVGLLHESNTFVDRPTTIADFEHSVLMEGADIRREFDGSHHEIGGFLSALTESHVGIVPLFVARALPSGIVTADAFNELIARMLGALHRSGPLDGFLVAPHGATVSEEYRDADGYWLNRLREHVGRTMPIVGTIDAHANLSPLMVKSVDALIAYRSNPHLDQRERGIEAGRLLMRTLSGDVRPTMAASFPPLAINIERQMTTEPHLSRQFAFADDQLQHDSVLSNSIVLGFPYADVAEMGTSTIVVTNNDPVAAQQHATELARQLWTHREDFRGRLLSIDEALHQCDVLPGPVCLLDMGDNVGGGSAADGTCLLHALHDRRRRSSFVCIFDPAAVDAARSVELNASLHLKIGGHVDRQHGRPLDTVVRVMGFSDGRFRETQVRHGGMLDFDQGVTAIVETDTGVTIMLTSRRMVPFSLEQLRSCGLDPAAFDILVAKGVNAPVAAYREVCRSFLRVDTPGSTRADMTQLTFTNRRRPMFPFETETAWNGGQP